MFIKCVWVGKSEMSDEHIVLTPGGRVFSRTIRRLEPCRRHDAGFLVKVKGLRWDAQDGIVWGQLRKEHRHHPFWLERTPRSTILTCQTDKTEDTHSETPKETDDTKDADNVLMSETPLNDGRDASHIKSKSSVDSRWSATAFEV